MLPFEILDSRDSQHLRLTLPKEWIVKNEFYILCPRAHWRDKELRKDRIDTPAFIETFTTIASESFNSLVVIPWVVKGSSSWEQRAPSVDRKEMYCKCHMRSSLCIGSIMSSHPNASPVTDEPYLTPRLSSPMSHMATPPHPHFYHTLDLHHASHLQHTLDFHHHSTVTTHPTPPPRFPPPPQPHFHHTFTSTTPPPHLPPPPPNPISTPHNT
ncbi:acrosin-like [Penaeus monodon]|uniref:acrosin-like n=1 Tax=Penaeus monodon TaxID=6687 RepID=UPI0018A77728|nr:acrosin-like [Penaeus monodon]